MNDLARTKNELITELVSLRHAAANPSPGSSPQRANKKLKSLEASEVTFRRLFEAARDGILILDAETGVITAVNPFLADLLGYSRQEMLGAKLWEIGPFADIKNSKFAFRELQRNHYIRYDDLPLQTKDGRIIAVEFVSNVYAAGGQQVIQCNIRDITERVATTKRLHLLATALDATASGMVITDATGLIEWVNPAFTRLTGYSAAESVGKNPRALVKSERNDPAVFANLWETILAGRIWKGDLVNRRKDGSLYTETQVITPMRDAAGNISHFIAVKLDITELKRAQDELLAANQALDLRATIGLSLTAADSLGSALQRCAEAMVNQLGVAAARIWTLDTNARMLTVEASASVDLELAGLQQQIAAGQSMVGRIAEDRKPYMTNSVIDDPRFRNPEWARREGIVAFAGHPLMVEDRVVGVMAVFSRHALTDTTTSALASVADHLAPGIELGRSAEALRISEERMRFALEAANVGTWEMDLATRECHWSDVFAAQCGLPRGTLGGSFEAIAARVYPEDRAPFLEAVATAEKSGGDFAILTRSIGWGGAPRWLEGAGRVHVDEHGTPNRATGVSLDVTERRSLEEQFRQSQKMESVGRLAGGVAHDFNNLLTVILGEAELASSDLEEGTSLLCSLEEIRKAGRRAADLTRRLLTFSRQQIHVPTVFDVNEMVAGVDTMLHRLIGENVRLVVRHGPTPTWVSLDRGELEQVLMNLVVNAHDAMPDGGELTIETSLVTLDDEYARLHADVRPGPYVQVAVSDTGIGMSREVQSHVFEPFFTTKQADKGTGLGLATTYGIVKAAGGHIAVYSELGIGTTVRLHLPLAHSGESAPEHAPAECRQGNGEVILLVEDEPQVRRVSQLMLEGCGYRVLPAASGEEALAILTHGTVTVDVLLTDVVMTGMNGRVLAERAAALIPGIRVLFATGYSGAVIDRHRLLDHGAKVIQKPFTKEVLARYVQEVLDSPRQ